MEHPCPIRLVTAESVRAGHPDKFCDRVADTLLDAYLAEDPGSRVAVEVMVTAGKILVAGEVSSSAEVSVRDVVMKAIRDIGYTPEDLSDYASGAPDVEIRVHEQSQDIAQAVDGEELGAGDQGIMVGYATNETPEFLPTPVVLSHRICHALDNSHLPWLGADGKAQVTVRYVDAIPVAVDTVVVSVQHDRQISNQAMREALLSMLVELIPDELLKPDTRILINPSGRFVKGGPAADTGLTGRKLAVDQYGPVARIGGGALSGKDPTKVDRSGAYAARYVAKNLVAAGLAKRCEVQIAYVIGRAKPVSVSVDAFGTGAAPNAVLAQAVREAFDLTPAAIIRDLGLCDPIYTPLSAYGHFGRPELSLPWEQMDKQDDLLNALAKQGYQV